MKIGLFAPGRFLPQAKTLATVLRSMPEASVQLFDLDLTDAKLRIERDGVFWNDTPLDSLDVVWIRGFPYTNPVLPAAEHDRDWSVWQYDYLADQQSFSALLALFQELERRGVRVLPSPRSQWRGFMRFAILEELRAANLRVPPLLSTNDPEQAKAFMERFETVVWRPATGRAAWQRFIERQREALVDPGKPPILLANAVAGPMVRSYLVGGQPVLSLETHPPIHNPPQESLEVVWNRSDLHLSESECITLTQRSDATTGLPYTLDWLQVNYVVSEEGPVIYDLDPDPRIDWLPEAHHTAVIEALARHLAGHAPVPVSSDLDTPAPRPVMFLRRMLRLLFEFEFSKYNTRA
ncbi:MAG: hypothetical protein HQL50_15465 [Magnetococcales bacterium]|nr:hypothetical protein [Magnetococcales bacterium]